MSKIYDVIPHCSYHSPNTLLCSDLKIIDFEFLRIFDINHIVSVPVYILTDSVPDFNKSLCYETMIRIGHVTDISSGIFLDYQERVYSKFEVYKLHKILLKKLKSGFFDNEILDIIRDEACVMFNKCQ